MKLLSNLRLIALLAALLLLTTSCVMPHTTPSNLSEAPASDTTDPSSSESLPEVQSRYFFANINAMRKTLPESTDAIVMLDGYTIAGDGGGGLFYWDSSDTTPDNGGTVIAPKGADTGRYHRIFDGMTFNVRWFGAIGNGSADDTEAIQAAIDALPDNGGEVILPGGTYRISKPLEVGNGTKDTPSTKNGIRLIGMGSSAGHETISLTYIRPKQEMEIMMKINGPIADCVISGIQFYGDGKVDGMMQMTDMVGCTIENVSAKNFRKTAYIYTAVSAVGSHDNLFKSVGSGNFINETTGIFIGGNPEAGALVSNTVFTDCRFDTSQTDNSIAAHIQYAEKLTFFRCHLNVYKFDTCTGLLLDATAKDGYPRQNSFYDCSVTRLYVSEDETHTIGHTFLLGHGTYDNEQFAKHPHIFGLTDIGTIIGANGKDN
ncbi:MAG: hypothetical protein E7618_05455 [Ruminococcaceae bacterium]|nr:hypothetical protein [Oscillospiraceae bacterium]